MTLEPGALIGDAYEVTAVLGHGGMGDVLAATQLATGRKVAIKTLRPEARSFPEFMERFRREAIAASRIRSESVCKLVDFLEDHDLGPVLVFEYLEGQTLAEALAGDGVFSFEEAHPLVSQIFAGLADAHAVGVIHRDLKPGNVFLEQRPGSPVSLKILDFGISKLPSGDGQGWEVLTKTGQSLGTFSYMAPEQIEGPSSVDKRADLYACGAVVFRMLTGTLPHVARGVPRLVMEKLNRPAKRLAQARPGTPFSAALEAFVAKLLERQPAARFSSAQQARQEWETLAPGPVNTEVNASSPMSASSSQNPKPGPGSPVGTPGRRAGVPRPSTPPPRPAGAAGSQDGSAGQPPARPASAPLSSGSPRHPAPGQRPGPSRFAAKTKTILGQPAPVQPPHRPPSIPTRVERPIATQTPAPPPPASPTAKAPPPPQRSFEKAPADDDIEEDEAPTAMFVHPVKYTYDPDGPPPQPGLLDEDEDEDDYEPATAIHVSPYRGDGSPGMPPSPSDYGQPPSPTGQPLGYPPSSDAPAYPASGPIASVAPTPPPGVQAAPVPSARQLDPRLMQTQELQAVVMPPAAQAAPAGMPIATDGMVTFVDPNAAPVWLKAMAVSSVVSALTVLGVLGWMITRRF